MAALQLRCTLLHPFFERRIQFLQLRLRSFVVGDVLKHIDGAGTSPGLIVQRINIKRGNHQRTVRTLHHDLFATCAVAGENGSGHGAFVMRQRRTIRPAQAERPGEPILRIDEFGTLAPEFGCTLVIVGNQPLMVTDEHGRWHNLHQCPLPRFAEVKRFLRLCLLGDIPDDGEHGDSLITFMDVLDAALHRAHLAIAASHSGLEVGITVSRVRSRVRGGVARGKYGLVLLDRLWACLLRKNDGKAVADHLFRFIFVEMQVGWVCRNDNAFSVRKRHGIR